MHPQLVPIADAYTAASQRAARLVAGLDDAAFQTRPHPESWSVGECLTHLNLMDEAMLPRIDAAVLEGQSNGADPARRYRRDPVGWILSWALEPPNRVKTRTAPQFVPTGGGSPEAVLSRFVDLKAHLRDRLEAASGLDLNRLRVRSPVDERIAYNLYSAFCVIAAHERRHLWQAEQGAARVAAASGS